MTIDMQETNEVNADRKTNKRNTMEDMNGMNYQCLRDI